MVNLRVVNPKLKKLPAAPSPARLNDFLPRAHSPARHRRAGIGRSLRVGRDGGSAVVAARKAGTAIDDETLN